MEELNQSRQPVSLQGLLRFSMEATKSEDAPPEELKPMDEERKKFLEAALSSLTIDVVEELQKQIRILRQVEYMSDENVNKFVEALECILDYVDNIDVANDFHKIGGFMILLPCLKSNNSKIRALCCELIGVLCQNNPYCQRVVLENNFLSHLLGIVEKDNDVQVVTKCLFALGGIVRENMDGISQFLQFNGPTILFKCLQMGNDNVIIKTCFLLTSVSKFLPEIKDQLIKLNYVHQLLNLFKLERGPSHEHILSFLVTILEDNPAGVKECRKFNYNVKEMMQRYMTIVRNTQFIEEQQLCRRMIHILNSEE